MSLATSVSSLPFGLVSATGHRPPPFLPSSPAGLLPPGMNPFFPHAGMMIPGGMPNPFQRFPGVSDPRLTVAGGLFDPTKAGFPRPGWPGGGGQVGSMSQKRASPIEIDDDLGMSLEQKKMRLQTSMRMLKDEPVPEGYMRFR